MEKQLDEMAEEAKQEFSQKRQLQLYHAHIELSNKIIKLCSETAEKERFGYYEICEVLEHVKVHFMEDLIGEIALRMLSERRLIRDN